MVWGAVAGLGLQAAGSVLQASAARKRERATERAMADIQAAQEKNTAEQLGLSDNLRRIMESLAEKNDQSLDQFLQARISEARPAAATEAERLSLNDAIAGAQRAIDVLRAPGGVTVSPGGLDDADVGAFATSSFGQSLNDQLAQFNPLVEARLETEAVTGFQRGAAGFDQEQLDILNLAMAGLRQEGTREQIGNQFATNELALGFQGEQARLNQAFQDAQTKGDNLALLGALAQTVGTGITGFSAFQDREKK